MAMRRESAKAGVAEFETWDAEVKVRFDLHE
jgi:hypothetical protein